MNDTTDPHGNHQITTKLTDRINAELFRQVNVLHIKHKAAGLIFRSIDKWCGNRVAYPYPQRCGQFIFLEQYGKEYGNEHLETQGRRHADKDAEGKPFSNLVRHASQTKKAE